MTETPRPAQLPGDRQQDREAMLRVDHAGEYGAIRIYAGQLAVMGMRHPDAAIIRHMEDQERRHLTQFETMMTARGVRPTALMPLWHVAGYALGVATALMGPRTAMACTAAVEDVIDKHYEAQHEALGADDPELSKTIAAFRQDEIAHRTTAIAHGAEQALGASVLSRMIGLGCRVAIRLSERF